MNSQQAERNLEMNSCCTLSAETIASDRHKAGEACCLITEKTMAPERAECPVSKTVSRRVQHRTVEHLVKPEKRALIEDVQYYFCAEPTCDVVYFPIHSSVSFTKNDMLVKVFSKDRGDDVSVCYCFDWTRARINEQIAASGKSTAAMEIAREIKAGRCLCDVKNPKGECCLGDVNRVVREAMLSHGGLAK
ncbi:MAG: (2Fe-2S)-binding protein [Bacteroidota bacterium]